MTQPSILLLSGLPASGKTTYALNWLAEEPDQRVRVNYDELRVELYGEGWRFNYKEEAAMKAVAIARASDALKVQKSVVIDNTNLTPRARKQWKDLAIRLGAAYEEHEIDTSVAECVRRDRLREGKARVGRAVIERMALFNGWIDWTDYEGEFVICDVDGTLADCGHRLHHIKPTLTHKLDCTWKPTPLLVAPMQCPQCGRKPQKDWDAFFAACKDDTPIAPIVSLAGMLVDACYTLIIVSGRPVDQCGKATEGWLDALESSASCYTHLFMRGGPHDHRPDYEVKQEILDLLPKERIAYVIDDRPQVLRMWQANGLTTLAVGTLKEF